MVFQLALILLPLIVANVAHMVMVTKDAFSGLAIPVNEKYFGKNKTWRGMIVVPSLNALVTLLVNWCTLQLPPTKALGIGLLMGSAYVLFELPNSYLKRRMGIPPGGTATRRRWLFSLLDKTDSALGVVLCCFLLFSISLFQSMVFLLSAIAIHMTFSLVLVLVRLKKSF